MKYYYIATFVATIITHLILSAFLERFMPSYRFKDKILGVIFVLKIEPHGKYYLGLFRHRLSVVAVLQ